MSEDWVDLVDLVEVDGAPAPIETTPPLVRRAHRPAIAFIAVAACVVASGSVVAVAGAHHHRRVIVRHVQATPNAADAVACPVSATCAVRPIALPRAATAVFGRATGTAVYDVNAPATVYAVSIHASGRYRTDPASLGVVADCRSSRGSLVAGKASSAEGPGSPTFTSSFVRRYRRGPAVTCTVDVWSVYVASFADGYPNGSPMMERLVAAVAADPTIAP